MSENFAHDRIVLAITVGLHEVNQYTCHYCVIKCDFPDEWQIQLFGNEYADHSGVSYYTDDPGTPDILMPLVTKLVRFQYTGVTHTPTSNWWEIPGEYWFYAERKPVDVEGAKRPRT